MSEQTRQTAKPVKAAPVLKFANLKCESKIKHEIDQFNKLQEFIEKKLKK